MASDTDRPERKQPFKPSDPTQQFRFQAPDSETAAAFDAFASPTSINQFIESCDEQLSLKEKIGEGGMGAVYKAQLPHSQDLVAVKMLHHNLVSDKVALRRFEKEAIAIGQLTHPNIVQVYGFVADNENPHIVMEYVDGCSLADIFRHERSISPQRVIDWVIQISSAVQHAHEKGVVHRDLKPTNILISETRAGDIIKIVDFGIAKLAPRAGTATELTQAGEVFGSPNYMSPEQCMGKPVDARTDVYSLGCVIYEALSGTNLFTGENAVQYLVQHVSSPVTEQLKSLKKLGVPVFLIAVLEKMLQKDPSKRYQTALEVENEFKRLAVGKPSVVSQRKLLVSAGIAGGSIAAIAAVVALTLFIPKFSSGASNGEQSIASSQSSASSASPHFGFNPLDGGAESRLQKLLQASKDNWTFITSQNGRDRAARDRHDTEYRELQSRLHLELTDMGVKAIPALLSFLNQREVTHECTQDLEALGASAVEPCVEWLKAHPRDYLVIAPVFWNIGKPACDQLAELTKGDSAERKAAASVLATRFARDHRNELMGIRARMRGNEKFLSTISQKYLVEGLKKETNFEVKRDLLLSLRNVDDPSATTCDAVVTLLKNDSNEDVKVASAGTIAYWANRVTGDVNAKLCKELTEVLIRDDSADVRAAAAEGLGALATINPDVITALHKAKRADSSNTVHQAALVALMKLADKDDALLPDLADALKDPEANTQYEALNAVRRLGPKAVSLVPDILQSKARIESKLDALAATETDDKQVQAMMIQSLDAADDINNWNRARAAIEYFSRQGSRAKAALPSLEKVADGKCPFRYQAKEAIKKIKGDSN